MYIFPKQFLNVCSIRAALRRERLEKSSVRVSPPGMKKFSFVVLYIKGNGTKTVTGEIRRIWKEVTVVIIAFAWKD
jgi:hypothetical protein